MFPGFDGVLVVDFMPRIGSVGALHTRGLSMPSEWCRRSRLAKTSRYSKIALAISMRVFHRRRLLDGGHARVLPGYTPLVWGCCGRTSPAGAVGEGPHRPLAGATTPGVNCPLWRRSRAVKMPRPRGAAVSGRRQRVSVVGVLAAGAERQGPSSPARTLTWLPD